MKLSLVPEIRPEPRLLELAARLSPDDLALLARLAEHLAHDPHAHFLREFLIDLIEQDR